MMKLFKADPTGKMFWQKVRNYWRCALNLRRIIGKWVLGVIWAKLKILKWKTCVCCDRLFVRLSLNDSKMIFDWSSLGVLWFQAFKSQRNQIIAACFVAQCVFNVIKTKMLFCRNDIEHDQSNMILVSDFPTKLLHELNVYLKAFWIFLLSRSISVQTMGIIWIRGKWATHSKRVVRVCTFWCHKSPKAYDLRLIIPVTRVPSPSPAGPFGQFPFDPRTVKSFWVLPLYTVSKNQINTTPA